MTLYNDSIQQLERIRTKRNPRNFRIVYMGDSWVGSGQVSDDIFEQAVKTAVATKPLLMVHGGDIIFSGKVREFKYFISELNKWNKDEDGNRIPMFITPGNHEMNLNKEGCARIQNFKDYIGPLHFNLDLPEYHLTMIGLNTLYNYVYKEYGLTTRELDFLKNSLAHKRCNTFVAMHVPPLEPEIGWTKDEDAFPNQRGRNEFYNLVTRNNHSIVSRVLVSHIHDFQRATVHNVKFILSGGAGATLNKGAQFHIVVINIENGIVTTEKVLIGG